MNIKVNARWAEEATRAVLRAAKLGAILSVILSELAPDRAIYWRKRIRGVDTGSDSGYDDDRISGSSDVSDNSTEEDHA